MSFLFPIGVVTLVSLPIIVWMHLRRQRLKRVVVPSLIFWHDLPRPHSAERRRLLPITLLLLLHLLIATLVSVALTNPHYVGWLMQTRRHVVVIVDTSTSMGARDTSSGTRINAAQDYIRTIINALTSNDRLTIISAATNANVLVSGDGVNRISLEHALNTLVAAGQSTDLAGGITLATTMLAADEHVRSFDQQRVVVLTDLRPPEAFAALKNTLHANMSFEWQRLGAMPENRAIVAFAARHGQDARGNTTQTVYARIANFSNTHLTTHIRLYGSNNLSGYQPDDHIDAQLIDTRLVVLKPQSEQEFTWDVPDTVRMARAELDGHDVFANDDIASVSLNYTRRINTLLVSQEPAAIKRVLDILPDLSVQTLTPDTYLSSPLAAMADMTIFDGTLPPSLQAFPIGGVLIIKPPATETTNEQQSPLLPMTGSRLLTNKDNVLLTDDAPPTFDELNLDSIDYGTVQTVAMNDGDDEDSAALNWAHPLLVAGNTPLILYGQHNRSTVILWTFDIHRLTNRLVFPLLVARTIELLVPASLPASHLVGTPLTVAVSPYAEHVSITYPTPDNHSEEFAISPTETNRSLFLQNLTVPGIYTVNESTSQRTTPVFVGHFAVNSGSSLESNLLNPHTPASVEEQLQLLGKLNDATIPSAATKTSSEQQQPLWAWVTIGALVLLVMEWLYYTRNIAPTKHHSL